MARTESRTKTAIWNDDDFRCLASCEQHLYWMLYSQATISLCGIVALTVKRWASNACDLTEDAVRGTLEGLEAKDYVLVDWQTEEVFVRTFARHDGVFKNPKTWFGAWERLKDVASQWLREAAEKELAELGPRPTDGRGKIGHRYPIDRPSIGHLEPDSLSIGNPPVPQSPVPSLQPPVPAYAPEAHDQDVVLRTEGTRPLMGLALRMFQACKTQTEGTKAEAESVSAWALAHVDPKVVEAAIGWAESKQGGDDPVKRPRGIAKVIHQKAVDQNISMPEYDPSKHLQLGGCVR